MEMKFRKVWPLIGATCIAAISSAFADSHTSNGYDSMSSNAKNSDQQDYQRGAYTKLLPPAGPRVANGVDVYVSADFIYYYMTNGFFDAYADTGSSTDNNDVPTPPLTAGSDFYTNTGVSRRGEELYCGQSWAPGFKVALGLNLAHDGMDIQAEYLYINGNDSASVGQMGDGVNTIIGPLVNLGNGVSAEINAERATRH